MKNNGEIIFYHPEESLELEVRLEDETVWLNRQQLSELFNRDIKTIGKHINNALKEELKDLPVVANFATTARDGKTYKMEFYNLDMILSIGYRVKSQSGIRFRIWANNVLKDYLLKGYAINQRIENIEAKLFEHDQKYAPVIIKQFKQSHDRFLLIDDKDIYHIGASLKDLGKKWFAFSKLNLDIKDIIQKII
ncbi:virulence RhuM family protein [Parabacteroides goldsteinii]